MSQTFHAVDKAIQTSRSVDAPTIRPPKELVVHQQVVHFSTHRSFPPTLLLARRHGTRALDRRHGNGTQGSLADDDLTSSDGVPTGDRETFVAEAAQTALAPTASGGAVRILGGHQQHSPYP